MQGTGPVKHTAPIQRADMQKNKAMQLCRRDCASGSKRVIKSKKKARSGSARLLHLKHTSTHAHALKLSVCLSGPVSWLQGLWDSPARWQPFLSQAGKTGSGFLCLCASDSYREQASEQACALFIFYLFAFLFFSKRHGRTPARAHLHRRAHERQEKRIYKQAETPKDELMGNA